MYIETSTEKIETNILFVFISTFIKEILLWWGMHQDIVLSISSECTFIEHLHNCLHLFNVALYISMTHF